jgi:hypothetical protein
VDTPESEAALPESAREGFLAVRRELVAALAELDTWFPNRQLLTRVSRCVAWLDGVLQVLPPDPPAG